MMPRSYHARGRARFSVPEPRLTVMAPTTPWHTGGQRFHSAPVAATGDDR